MSKDLFADSYPRKQIIARLVNVLMTAVTVTARDSFSHPLFRFRAALPAEHKKVLDRIRDMSHAVIINKPAVQQLDSCPRV